ncbi:MAG: glycosyltransferase family 4 protein, partial [Deltaproteobacteria bacterium]|nr:glycosyltransferase family 4 protein [Deltaproteobacteria bacterium]
RVLFVGETDNVAQYYGVGDLLVLPTLYDPFSNVCLEALASAIPVVTTQENGAAEIIRPGQTGSVISDPSNCEELAGAISPFLSLEKRASFQAEAAESVKRFTIEENTRRTMDVYQRVVLMKKEVASAESKAAR